MERTEAEHTWTKEELEQEYAPTRRDVPMMETQTRWPTLRAKAAREPLDVAISDFGDEYYAGFLAGQVNLLDWLERGERDREERDARHIIELLESGKAERVIELSVVADATEHEATTIDGVNGLWICRCGQRWENEGIGGGGESGYIEHLLALLRAASAWRDPQQSEAH
jgi:hypothetical protein